ncbi:MAG: DUF2911 domain-containing protein [Cyclobacteriaceae bacterium]|nr:DUF2911 domain-containing protein [Cyclobacteriaceae bacterium]
MKQKVLCIVAGILLVAIGSLAYFFLYGTKSYSPEATVVYEQGGTRVSVFYNRPYKKGRQIFGSLVPFGKVWRTGANEPTQLETNVPLKFQDQALPAGRYSVWTIPGEQSWTVILNSEIPRWGINFTGEATRNPQTDVVKVEVPVMHHEKEVVEQFTILLEKSGEEMQLTFLWDQTLVAVPFTAQ